MPIAGRRGRPLLVGEADPPCGVPMMGRSGRFLAGLVGMELGEFLRAFECVNLLPRDGPRAGKGRRFGPAELAEASRRARSLRLRGRVVVLAGKRVAAAFGLPDPPWLTDVWLGRGEWSCVVVPHPSGIVLWWNDRGNRGAAAAVLLGALGGRRGTGGE